MHQRMAMPHSLHETLARQSGAISWSQAAAAGLTRAPFRRLSRDWVQLAPGLYSAFEPVWETALWAGLLRGGAGALAGGRAAAFLHDLTDRRPQEISVWVPPGVVREPLSVGPWAIRFRRGDRAAAGLAIPTVSVECALQEVAAAGDENEVIAAVTVALRQRPEDPAALVEAIARARGTRHEAVVGAVCLAAMEGVESILEWRYRTAVEQAHGLPIPTRQLWTSARTRCDVMYEDYGVIVELDGSQHRAGPDRRRDNGHAMNLRAVTLRYVGLDLFARACAVAGEVGWTLRGGGWQGRPQSCGRCG